ncbi:hypothetical protein LTR17_027204, partial [Elasticomyces elasticus]
MNLPGCTNTTTLRALISGRQTMTYFNWTSQDYLGGNSEQAWNNGPSGVVPLTDAAPGYNLEQYGTDFDDADAPDPLAIVSDPLNCNTPGSNSTPICQVVGDDYTDYYTEYFAGGTTSSPGCTLS